MLWPALIVMSVTVVCFWPVVGADFVSWDDAYTLTGNPYYRGLGWEPLSWMWTTFHMGHYQPLTWMSFGLDYQLWGMDPHGYHLTSLIVHTLSAGVFYVVALQLLSRAGVESLWSAALAALLFAVHPLRVECVGWVTDRLDLLSGLWWLLTIAAYLRAQQVPERRRRWIVVAVACYALSLLSKGIGVTLPIVLVILDVYPLRRLGRDRGGWWSRQVRRVWLEKVPFFALAAAGGATAFLAKRVAGGMSPIVYEIVTQRVAQMFYNQAFYVWKTILPFGLVPLYQCPERLSALDWPFVLSAGLVLSVSVVVVIMRRRWPWALATWIAYLVILLPVSGLVQSGVQLAADRYSYHSCMGFAILAGAGVSALLRQRGLRHITFGASVLLVVILGMLTRKQTQLWQNGETLWRGVIESDPNAWVAYCNLGTSLWKSGRKEEASRCYQRAVRLAPTYAAGRCGLARALSEAGRMKEAQAILREGLVLAPDQKLTQVPLLRTLGLLKIEEESWAEAKVCFDKLVVLEPGQWADHYHLGVALAQLDQFAEAMGAFDRAVELDSGWKRASLKVGIFWVQLGLHDVAIAAFRTGLEEHPDNFDLANSLAWVLATCPQDGLRDGAEAVRLAEAVRARVGSNNPTVLDTLAAAYAEAGRFEEAVATAERALAAAGEQGMKELVDKVEKRLGLYRQGKAYHEPEGTK